MISAPKNILIVNINLIGDVILTTPLIGLLSEAYPGTAIDFLANRGTGELLEKDPRIRRVIYSDGNEIGSKRKKNGYLQKIFQRYDLAIGMSASDRINVAVAMAGRKMRIGFYKRGAAWKSLWQRILFTHPLESSDAMPVARNCNLIANALKLQHTELKVKIYWDSADESKVSGILEKHGLHGPFFLIHPFARWIYKYWCFDGFAAVSDYIFERYGLQPVWTSSPSVQETAQLTEAADMCRHKPLIIGGELTLNQMTYLLGLADFYLGLDTAISHLAASTGIPMVALYGPTFTSRWFPFCNQLPHDQEFPTTRGILCHGNIVVVQKDFDCVPCGKAGCDDSGNFTSPCLQEISVEEVLSAVEICLATSNSRLDDRRNT